MSPKGLWCEKFLCATIGDIDKRVNCRKRKKPAAVTPKRTRGTGRHVTVVPDSYTLIREGKPLESTSVIDTLFAQGSITESLFFLFRRTEDEELIERNDTMPVYEALYLCGGNRYVRVQKKHLEMAYRQLGRSEKARMWDIMSDGTPYWVDRHCFTKMGQRDSKRRYEEKIKNKTT